MTPSHPETRRSTALATIARAGTLCAIVDGAWACVLSAAYHSTSARVFQGVAATVLGPDALTGGTRTALIGVAMHVGVAFGWSTVFYLLATRVGAIGRTLRSPLGVPKVAALYGPFVWLVMSLAVIPVLLHRPPSITLRWVIQLFGHAPFVGLPIVLMVRRGLSPESASTTT